MQIRHLLVLAAALTAASPLARAAGGANVPADPNVVTAREDSLEVKDPASRLGAVTVAAKDGVAAVHLAADGQVARFGLVELKNPARLAIDLHGVAGRFDKADGAALVKSVRIAKRDDGTRIVIDAEGDTMPKYAVARSGHGLDVLVGEPKPARIVASASPAVPAADPEPEAKTEVVKPSTRPNLVPVRAVDLRTIDGRTEVLVALEASVRFEISRPEATTAILTLHGAALPERLERNLDAGSLGGPVTMLSTYRV